MKNWMVFNFIFVALVSGFSWGQDANSNRPHFSSRLRDMKAAKHFAAADDAGTSSAPTGPSPYDHISWYEQKLDHFDGADTRHFKQRYIFDADYAKDVTAPVIYYVCGEGDCMGGELNPDQWIPLMAKQMGAYLIALEHRYYGKSQPYKWMNTKNLSYLNIEQAIQDLVIFQKGMTEQNHLQGKWIAVGGSYPASLASIYRMQYPHLVAGAIASSDCAWIDQGDATSDKLAAQAIGEDCVAKYKAVVLGPIEKALGDKQAMGNLKKIFDGEDIIDDLDFLGTVSGSAVGMVQYGDADGFCKALNDPQPLQAFAKELAASLDPGTRLINASYTGGLKHAASLYETGFGFRQWQYQACTQEGLFSSTLMYANPDQRLSLSSALTNGLPAKYCGVYFDITPPKNLRDINAKYYYPLLKPSTSNILFVSGSNDPACFPYSISKEHGNATNPNTVAYTVDGGTHCEEMDAPKDTDSASLKGARDLELELATKWTR